MKASGAAAGLLAALESLLGALCAGLLALALIASLATAILRYVFGAGFPGSEDLGIWLHVALIALGAPLALGSALAMRFDLLTKLLPERGKAAAGLLADVFTLLAGLVLASGGLRIGMMLGGTSPTLGLPEWMRFGFLGVGGALILLALTLRRIAGGETARLLLALALSLALHLAAARFSVSAAFPPSLTLGLIALLGLLTGAPLPHAFIAAAYLAIPFGSPLPEQSVAAAVVTGMSKFLLLAIPFFLLAGGFLASSGAAARMLRFAAALVGHRRGGLAQTALLTSVLFSGASGSSVANAAFGATAFQPELAKNGYPPAQAGALVAAASTLDNVIPPSIAFLLLAAATNLSVGALMLGGFAAGGVMALCLAAAIRLTAPPEAVRPRAGAQERLSAAKAALPALGLGMVIVAGVRMGLTTVTEAAALAACHALLLGLSSGMRARALFGAFRQAAVEASAVGLLIGAAGPFALLLAMDGVSGLLSGFVSGLGWGPLGVMLLLNLMLLLIGLVLDVGAAILLFAPIFLPLAVAAGIDPVYFGVILVANLMIGGLTPPAGILIYVVSGATRIPAGALFRAVGPYLAALLCSLGLLVAGALLL